MAIYDPWRLHVFVSHERCEGKANINMSELGNETRAVA